MTSALKPEWLRVKAPQRERIGAVAATELHADAPVEVARDADAEMKRDLTQKRDAQPFSLSTRAAVAASSPDMSG